VFKEAVGVARHVIRGAGRVGCGLRALCEGTDDAASVRVVHGANVLHVSADDAGRQLTFINHTLVMAVPTHVRLKQKGKKPLRTNSVWKTSSNASATSAQFANAYDSSDGCDVSSGSPLERYRAQNRRRYSQM
jgi:hypothetical protein